MSCALHGSGDGWKEGRGGKGVVHVHVYRLSVLLPRPHLCLRKPHLPSLCTPPHTSPLCTPPRPHLLVLLPRPHLSLHSSPDLTSAVGVLTHSLEEVKVSLQHSESMCGHQEMALNELQLHFQEATSKVHKWLVSFCGITITVICILVLVCCCFHNFSCKVCSV